MCWKICIKWHWSLEISYFCKRHGLGRLDYFQFWTQGSLVREFIQLSFSVSGKYWPCFVPCSGMKSLGSFFFLLLILKKHSVFCRPCIKTCVISHGTVASWTAHSNSHYLSLLSFLWKKKAKKSNFWEEWGDVFFCQKSLKTSIWLQGVKALLQNWKTKTNRIRLPVPRRTSGEWS